MVAWYWLVVAAWIGALVGVGVAAVLIHGRTEEERLDFTENPLLTKHWKE